MSTDLSWRDLVPDSLQGWQEHEEQMDRFSEVSEVELEARAEELLLCECAQRDADSFDGRACPVHSKIETAGDARIEAAYYNPEVPRKPVQMEFEFRRKVA